MDEQEVLNVYKKLLDENTRLRAANRALVEVYNAAVAAYTFVDPLATTIDFNAKSITHGDVKERLGDALQAASSALAANGVKP